MNNLNNFRILTKALLFSLLMQTLLTFQSEPEIIRENEFSRLDSRGIQEFCDSLAEQLTQYSNSKGTLSYIKEYQRSVYFTQEFVPQLLQESQFNFVEPVDQRNLTVWLYQELKNNIKTPMAQYIKNIVDNRNFLDTQALVKAFILFKALVEDKARYDFKHKIYQRFGYFQVLDDGLQNLLVPWGVHGNIHYGYLGSGLGFSKLLLTMAAGFAQMTDPKYENQRNLCIAYISQDRLLRFGDDLSGHENTVFGADLWEKYDSQFSINDFRKEIAERKNIITLISTDLMMPPEQFPKFVPGRPETRYGIFNGLNAEQSWPSRWIND